ncbi:hypothetical protein EAH89_30390 [Roseomonas nepalensis]|uniref:KTSC domain-containing protein n=1 Tax=Muricoccus nepalensis TaxID=1854500 RepID=A0A502EIC2_9PROT|nr:hypothetical protein [Roseomonas nepalensis]TPG36246.1 hypothetical protein EAH89_30390 [Roseomonas nepalensis]
MSRSLLLGLSLLLASAAGPAGAETCSSSTLSSADFAVARWCGDPPAPGTLRLVRRGGGAEEFLNVPLDTFREVVRTPRVARYVEEEVAPRFERGVARAEPPLAAARRRARVEGTEAPVPAGATRRSRRPEAAGDEAGPAPERAARASTAARLRAAARRRAEAERG